ncbi:hypothetical protein SBDP1_40033 [Syntrophobacter sp. SbD1]|nr:hypothetical protein SBDP1_40033 [Syntrophobacter sp. SbD1]
MKKPATLETLYAQLSGGLYQRFGQTITPLDPKDMNEAQLNRALFDLYKDFRAVDPDEPLHEMFVQGFAPGATWGDLLRKTELDFFRHLRRPSFSPDHENREVLSDICRQLVEMGIEEPDDLETGPTPGLTLEDVATFEDEFDELERGPLPEEIPDDQEPDPEVSKKPEAAPVVPRVNTIDRMIKDYEARSRQWGKKEEEYDPLKFDSAAYNPLKNWDCQPGRMATRRNR